MSDVKSLKNIRGQPEFIKGIGNVYPIKIKDYDKFLKVSHLLSVSRNHFEKNEYPLLILLISQYKSLGYENEEIFIKDVCKLFCLTTHKNYKLFYNSENDYLGFMEDVEDEYSGEISVIDTKNYDEFRKVVMKQNIILEPKIYKDKLVQEWAEKALSIRQKSGEKITFEDMITTVKNYNGYTYEQIDEMTVYQLYSDFYRVCKDRAFLQGSLFATVSSEKVTIEHFAESLNLYKSPYDDLFVDSSKKLGKLNEVMK